MRLFSKSLIGESNSQAIVQAIRQAEKNTSGEIKVHIEKKCEEDVLERAFEVFLQLGMQKTKQRNAVLIYVALEDKVFAILGDEGIHQKVPVDFWESTKVQMFSLFKENKIVEGIIVGTHLAGEKLRTFFPYQKDDKNELSDEVSFG